MYRSSELVVGCVVVAARRCRVGIAVWGMLHACCGHLTHAIYAVWGGLETHPTTLVWPRWAAASLDVMFGAPAHL